MVYLKIEIACYNCDFRDGLLYFFRILKSSSAFLRLSPTIFATVSQFQHLFHFWEAVPHFFGILSIKHGRSPSIVLLVANLLASITAAGQVNHALHASDQCISPYRLRKGSARCQHCRCQALRPLIDWLPCNMQPHDKQLHDTKNVWTEEKRLSLIGSVHVGY